MNKLKILKISKFIRKLKYYYFKKKKKITITTSEINSKTYSYFSSIHWEIYKCIFFISFKIFKSDDTRIFIFFPLFSFFLFINDFKTFLFK